MLMHMNHYPPVNQSSFGSRHHGLHTSIPPGPSLYSLFIIEGTAGSTAGSGALADVVSAECARCSKPWEHTGSAAERRGPSAIPGVQGFPVLQSAGSGHFELNWWSKQTLSTVLVFTAESFSVRGWRNAVGCPPEILKKRPTSRAQSVYPEQNRLHRVASVYRERSWCVFITPAHCS